MTRFLIFARIYLLFTIIFVVKFRTSVKHNQAFLWKLRYIIIIIIFFLYIFFTFYYM